MNFLYETNLSLSRWDLENRVMYSTIGICFPFVKRNVNKWAKQGAGGPWGEANAKFDWMYSGIKKDGINSENNLLGFRCMVK